MASDSRRPEGTATWRVQNESLRLDMFVNILPDVATDVWAQTNALQSGPSCIVQGKD